MKTILEARKAAKMGVATVDELYQALLKHGYHFEGKEENRKTVLRTALRKKNTDFHRLPHGGYGLREWYDKIKSTNDAADKELKNTAPLISQEAQEEVFLWDEDEDAQSLPDDVDTEQEEDHGF